MSRKRGLGWGHTIQPSTFYFWQISSKFRYFSWLTFYFCIIHIIIISCFHLLRFQICVPLISTKISWWFGRTMSSNGPVLKSSNFLDPEPPPHIRDLKRKSEVNFRDTLVTFNGNGNVSTGMLWLIKQKLCFDRIPRALFSV